MDKQTLKQYGALKLEHELLMLDREDVARMRADAMAIAPPKNDGMPRVEGAEKDTMAKKVCRYVDKERETNSKFDRLDDRLREAIERNVDEREAIENFIELISDPCLRNIMRLKYIHKKTWEQVAEETNYDERHVRRLHDKLMALKKSCP